MSTAKYTKNPHRVYTVKYSYESQGISREGAAVIVNPKSESAAIEEAVKSLTIAHLPKFKAWVSGYKDW